MRENDLALCRICLEPVTNSICIDCLYEQTYDWIYRDSKHLISVLTGVHKKLSDIFGPTEDNIEFCIKCKQEKDNVICPYCYVRDLFSEFRKYDPVKAKEFIALFNFDFENIGYMEQYSCNNTGLIFEETDNKEHSICHLCGNMSEMLYAENGMHVCETCKD